MNDFALDLDAYAGADIDRCSERAQAIADLLGVVVRFDFNGVNCLAVPGGDAVHLAQNQQSEQTHLPKGPYDRKVANSRARLFVAKETAHEG